MALAAGDTPEPASSPSRRSVRRRRRTERRRREAANGSRAVSGVARVDRHTKRLVKRLRPGDVAVIDHPDLDRVAAETLVDAAPAAVVNASASITGRYPNVGPLLLCQAGIPLVDGAGGEVMDAVVEGAPVTVEGDRVLVGGTEVARGTRQSPETLDAAIDDARDNLGPELERFAVNTADYVRQEIELLTGKLDVPDLDFPIAGRHVLIVVRGIDYKEDLRLLQRSGYLRELRPVLIGVDGGADALLEIGAVPDLIIGDFDSVSEQALHCGAQLIVHGYTDGRAPGAKRLDDLDLPYSVFSAPGTSEDVAMLLAYQEGAELMVAVGAHSNMLEFLDKGRAGMASTFLVRMKVGSALVDAKGVSRLYRHSVRTSDLVWMIAAAIFTLAVALMLSEPVRLMLRAFWRSLFSG
ncbi:MAG TPA: putative cytokinetic ring protein SteA [Acidimicrobiales bacterium]|nr:putative cytokinetic ring protein SteA [Acidimicrobiales bacterium]